MSKPVAIITGGGRGIGKATALALNEIGYRLALLARREADIRDVASQCSDAIALPTDVADAKQLERAVEKTHGHFGQIDAAIHVAGLAPILAIQDTSIEEWHQVMDVNLTAAFVLAKSCWPIFKQQGGGVIVNVSSLAARDPFAGFLAYGAAKAGINTFGLALAREGAPMNIRVHTVAPGAVETEMFRSIMTEEQFPKSLTMSPADVALAIAHCVTGDLKYTSGEVIYLRKTP